MNNTLIQNLKQAAKKDKALNIDIIETHISWILLVDDFAYKIKKPIHFNFIDYSSLKLRKHWCDEELTLNQRFSSDIYIKVIAISGSIEHPILEGSGKTLEFAVKMHRFKQKELLSSLADLGELNTQHIDSMAQHIALFHQKTESIDTHLEFGSSQTIYHWVDDNLAEILELVNGTNNTQKIKKIRQQTNQLFNTIKTTLDERKKNGFIKNCHGDCHLGNMLWHHQQVVLFDGIEFNPALRWIDIISEAAFVVMDLQARTLNLLAWRFLNHWLSITGDYEGLKLIKFYMAYLALVRAKVALLQIDPTQKDNEQLKILNEQFSNYAELAQTILSVQPQQLILTVGVSGSGKSTLATRLSEQQGLIHLRSDIERKRLFGVPFIAKNNKDTTQKLYNSNATELTYKRLSKLASSILSSGFSVIVDATFLLRNERLQFASLAKKHNVTFKILYCYGDKKTLERRINKRKNDPSDATIDVLKMQLDKFQDIQKNEATHIEAIEDVLNYKAM